jgi:alkaline phosphatase D
MRFNSGHRKDNLNDGQCSLLIKIFIFFTMSLTTTIAQNKFPEDVQYKKLPTDAIATIASGNPDEAIKKVEKYLIEFPEHTEFHFCMAVAYAVKNNITKSIAHINLAMKFGMPIERFVAGPRDLLKNTVESSAFQELLQSRSSGIIHGPMLGNVTATSAKIWLRTAKEEEVTVVLIKNGDEKEKEFSNKTLKSKDFTVVIQVKDLEPSTEYRYSIKIEGNVSFKHGTFQTIKNKGEHIQLKIGFGGGAGYTPWFEKMWDTLAVQSFDTFLLLGDNVYIDYPKVPEAQEYCYYRRQSRPEFRRFTSNVPMYAIWDDHDFTVNDGEGGSEIERPAWKRPVFNLFKNQWVNPYYAGGDQQPGCWFDFSMGDIDFIMLDCRYYRENPKEISDPSMLGSVQKEWLKERLKSSKATFKIIASSVPWAKDTKPGSDDTWDGFPEEREELFSFIEENKIEGVVLLSADRHRSDAWKIKRPNGYPLYDLMSSRLTNIHTHDILQESLFGYNKKCSFGTLEFDTTIDDPSVTYMIKNIDNEEIHKMTLYKSQLDFKRDMVKNKKLK